MHWTILAAFASLCATAPRIENTGPSREHRVHFNRGGLSNTMVVGWNDEMNDLDTWELRDGGMPPEVFATRRGEMTLRLAHVPDGYPYNYQWGGVTRTATVDLGRYPILVARVNNVKPGSYCHLDVEQLDYAGHPVKTLRTPTLERAGLSALDLGKEYGPHVWRLVLRINVGGKLEGAQAEVSWVRFARREDLPLLKELPDLQAVRLEP